SRPPRLDLVGLKLDAHTLIVPEASFAIEITETTEDFFRVPTRETSIAFLRPEGLKTTVFEYQVLEEWFGFLCRKSASAGRNTNLYGDLNVSVEPLAVMQKGRRYAFFVKDRVFEQLPNGIPMSLLDVARALADSERPVIQEVIDTRP